MFLALGPSLLGGIPFAPDTAEPELPPLAPLSLLRENLTTYGIVSENLSREDVRIGLDMEFRTLDFDALGVVFGGGTFEAQARLSARVEIRAIGLERLDEALESATQGRASLSRTPLALDVNRTHVSADELRSLLAGELLAAFEGAQEDAMEALVAEAFPDLILLSSRFAWSNVNPLVNDEGDASPTSPRLLEPPIALDVSFDVQYLKRESLMDLLRDALRDDPLENDAAEEALLERLKAQQQAAFYERSAFSVLGLEQVFDLGMPPGWDLVLQVRLPKGYTFEDASPDVAVADRYQSALVLTLAGESAGEVSNPVLVAISNRYLVSVSLLAIVLLCGALLRPPALLVATRWRRRK